MISDEQCEECYGQFVKIIFVDGRVWDYVYFDCYASYEEYDIMIRKKGAEYLIGLACEDIKEIIALGYPTKEDMQDLRTWLR